MNNICHRITLVSSLIFCVATYTMDNEKKKNITINNKTFSVSIPHAHIQELVKKVAQQISTDYVGKKPVFVGVLNGAFMFLSDLVKEVDPQCESEIDFVKISSYGSSMSSSGNVTIEKGLSRCIKDRDVIIVEDIIDSGRSIKSVRDLIAKENPQSIRIASLLHKRIANPDFPIDYVCLDINPDFVIGYGLDYDQKGRNLKDIYSLVQ